MAKESPIKHIAVLGAGVMGAQLAGLFAKEKSTQRLKIPFEDGVRTASISKVAASPQV